MKRNKALCTAITLCFMSGVFATAAISLWADCQEGECCPVMKYVPFPIAGEATVAYDSFRSLPEGSFADNSGAYVSLNAGTFVPRLECYGIGFQAGGSYGVYDWQGRCSSQFHVDEVYQQSFVTVGLFRKTPCDKGLNFGIVYDWMINDNLGAFAVHPTLEQLRFKGGFQWNRCNEIGLWGTASTHTKFGEVSRYKAKFRSFSLINLYWQHNFVNGGKTMVWAGVPYNRGLRFSPGTDGKWQIGAAVKAPLCYRWSITGHASYLRPRSASSFTEAKSYASNVSLGLTYTFGHTGPCVDPACDVSPYLPVADNSSFIVDTEGCF